MSDQKLAVILAVALKVLAYALSILGFWLAIKRFRDGEDLRAALWTTFAVYNAVLVTREAKS